MKDCDCLEVLSRLLLRCFFYTVAVMFLWFFMIWLAGDFVFSVHQFFFEITREQFIAMNYFGIAILKLVAFLSFLFPWFAIRQEIK